MPSPLLRPGRLGALVALGLALLVLGCYVGAHAAWLPAPIGNPVVGDRQANVVHRVLSDIHASYYRKVDGKSLTDSGVAAMIGSLHDPFSHYFSASEYKQLFGSPHVNGVGIDVVGVKRGLRVVDVFTGAPAARAGLVPGDVITQVGSTPLAGHSSKFAQHLIRGRPGTWVALHVLVGSHHRVLRIKRTNYVVPVATSHLIVRHGIKLGYVQLTTFNQAGAGDEVHADVEQAIHQGARGIILDLRGNGGGLINEAVTVASTFIPSGTITTIAGRRTPRQVFRATGGAISARTPVVVLVDRQTASASEIVTAALQDYGRALVIGTHTFGKGVFQDSFGLPNGGILEIVSGYYYTPKGRNLGGGGVKEGAGVTPNIYANENPRSKVDHQLQVAIKTLLQKVR